jgi:cytidylate kinase
MIITIGGLPGAGSTTVAKAVADKLGYKLVTVGELHKQIAAQEGIPSAELEKFWAQGAKDPVELKRLHNSLDRMQKDAARKHRNVVFNGKLSAFQIPWAGLKVFLVAPLEVRAERIAGREGIPKAKAARSIKEREEWERKEWKKIYGFDYVAERDIYDLVINTAHWDAGQIAKIIEMVISKGAKK